MAAFKAKSHLNGRAAKTKPFMVRTVTPPWRSIGIIKVTQKAQTRENNLGKASEFSIVSYIGEYLRFSRKTIAELVHIRQICFRLGSRAIHKLQDDSAAI